MKAVLRLFTTALALTLTTPAIAQESTREFQATQSQIALTRKLSRFNFARFEASDESIAGNIDLTCRVAKKSGSLEILRVTRLQNMERLNQTEQMILFDFFSSIDAVALGHVCPEYRYLIE